jgi:predicted GNAT superfamily acetyltransferase
VRIQREIWNYPDAELYPFRLFVNLGHIGGHVVGAFTSEGEQVGLVASLPAWRAGRRYFYSLLLGVVAGHEGRGLGRALKLAQRERALADGIDCIEWSFDPLRAKNANLNINRLGALVRRYEPDRYGSLDSRFQRGLPSDRLIAEWWLESPRVQRALAGEPVRDALERPARVIEIPTDIDALIHHRLPEAQAWQNRVRQLFQKSFAENLMVTGFTLGEKSAHYLLDTHED